MGDYNFMNKELIKYNLDDKYIFDFYGLNQIDCFYEMISLIENVIKPDKINYNLIYGQGIFMKNNIEVEFEHCEVIGNCCKCKLNDDIEQVGKWANLIFDKLIIGKKGKF